MKNWIFGLLLSVTMLWGCGGRKGPDVSNIKAVLAVQRFEADFFAIDTNRIYPSLEELGRKYPGFLPDFLTHIMGLPPVTDTGTQVLDAIRKFIADYRPVYDSSNKTFPDLQKEKEAIIDGLKHVRYYFPQYRLPSRLVTFIGPMDAYFEGSTGGYGDAITTDALAVGLQLHMGADFSIYTSQMGQSLYPRYISRRFTPASIPVNCLKNIVDDLYPDNSSNKTLVEQMVEKGKRLYLLDRFMPNTADTLKIGYTGRQLKGCYENEGLIWNFFLTNSLVYSNDPSIIKGYIGDAPGTQELGEGSPGFIGLFTGWRIVQKFMDKNPDLPLDALMKKDPRQVFEESKYRPK